MGAGTKIDDDDGINDINVTPLVDVMLVLLVIFMVASIYIVKDAIEVAPKAAKTSDVLETTLSIVLDRGGALYLNGKPTTEAIIASACKTAAAKNRNAQAIIAADHTVVYGSVIRLIDLVRNNGLERFAINVKRAGGGAPAAPKP